jgi:hypothetical protein
LVHPLRRQHASLCETQQVGKSCAIGDIRPHTILVSTTSTDGRQVYHADEHGLPRQRQEVAEVGLRRGVQRGDDLVPPGGDGDRVTGHAVEESAAAGRRVVEVVNISVELAFA